MNYVSSLILDKHGRHCIHFFNVNAKDAIASTVTKKAPLEGRAFFMNF